VENKTAPIHLKVDIILFQHSTTTKNSFGT